MTDPAKDTERLARLRQQRDDAPIRYSCGVALAPMVNFQWIEVDFLFQQLDRLTQERDEARRSAGPRYRHKKRGTTYRVIGEANSQVVGEPIGEGDLVVVYRADSDGTLWVRRKDEFYDGRFEALPAVPPANPSDAAPAQTVGAESANAGGHSGQDVNVGSINPDDVERARDTVQEIDRIEHRYSQLSRVEYDRLRQDAIIAALTGARREDAELWVLYRAIIEAARATIAEFRISKPWPAAWHRLVIAFAALDAATDGEG